MKSFRSILEGKHHHKQFTHVMQYKARCHNIANIGCATIKSLYGASLPLFQTIEGIFHHHMNPVLPIVVGFHLPCRCTMVRKGRDIHPLLTRRMDMWEARRLAKLLQETQWCDKQLASSMSPLTPEQLERIFSRLMMEVRVSSAVRPLTKRGGINVLDPEAGAHGDNGLLGKSVFKSSWRNIQHRNQSILVPSLNVRRCHR